MPGFRCAVPTGPSRLHLSKAPVSGQRPHTRPQTNTLFRVHYAFQRAPPESESSRTTYLGRPLICHLGFANGPAPGSASGRCVGMTSLPWGPAVVGARSWFGRGRGRSRSWISAGRDRGDGLPGVRTAGARDPGMREVRPLVEAASRRAGRGRIRVLGLSGGAGRGAVFVRRACHQLLRPGAAGCGQPLRRGAIGTALLLPWGWPRGTAPGPMPHGGALAVLGSLLTVAWPIMRRWSWSLEDAHCPGFVPQC